MENQNQKENQGTTYLLYARDRLTTKSQNNYAYLYNKHMTFHC